jgi:hypothetical protein
MTPEDEKEYIEDLEKKYAEENIAWAKKVIAHLERIEDNLRHIEDYLEDMTVAESNKN